LVTHLESELGAAEIAGKYLVLEPLGEGGTANVFLAVMRGPAGFNKLVVLKVLRRSLASDPDLRRMFLVEARLSARLNHPNIVEVNEIIEHDGLPTIVMSYLEGEPLSRLILRAGEQLSLAMRLHVLCEALSGLHYSHELADFDGTMLKVVHRDMSPQNVFVTFDGRVKVLDFGIAKLGALQGNTKIGVIKGKVHYMPPEQLVGETIDRRADIFAVGVMLWEAATGQRMWQGLTDAAVANRVRAGVIPSPSAVNPDCPEELDRICRKALSVRKEDRHATAAELQGELEALTEKIGPRVTSKEIGGLVAALFKDEHAETRARIASKLVEEGSFSFTDERFNSLWVSPEMGSYVSQRTTPRLPKRGSKALVLGAALLFVVLALVVVISLGRSPRPAALPKDRAAAGEPNRPVQVRITVFPRTAAISLDDQQLAQNPYVTELAPDHAWHTVRAAAPGHDPSERKFRLDENVDMVVTLDPVARTIDAGITAPLFVHAPPAHPPPPKKAVELAPPSPAELPPRAPEVDCSTPSEIDEHGVKRFKLGCL
jgi:serine/threonine protein kinase